MNKRINANTGRVNLSLDLQAKKDLLKIAAITGQTLSAIINDLIEAEMKRQGLSEKND